MSKIVLELPDESLDFVEVSVYVDPVSFIAPNKESLTPFERVVCFNQIVPGDYITAKIER